MFSLVNVSEKECSSRPVPELTPGDLRGLSDMSRRRWCPDNWWFSGFKILISHLQAVVAASTQGEDRKEAPSDDLTPGACLLMLALWNVEVPQRPTGGDYGGRQRVQEAIVSTICKPFRNTMDHTLWQWCFSRTNWKITTPAHPKFGTTL